MAIFKNWFGENKDNYLESKAAYEIKQKMMECVRTDVIYFPSEFTQTGKVNGDFTYDLSYFSSFAIKRIFTRIKRSCRPQKVSLKYIPNKKHIIFTVSGW